MKWLKRAVGAAAFVSAIALSGDGIRYDRLRNCVYDFDGTLRTEKPWIPSWDAASVKNEMEDWWHYLPIYASAALWGLHLRQRQEAEDNDLITIDERPAGMAALSLPVDYPLATGLTMGFPILLSAMEDSQVYAKHTGDPGWDVFAYGAYCAGATAAIGWMMAGFALSFRRPRLLHAARMVKHTLRNEPVPLGYFEKKDRMYYLTRAHQAECEAQAYRDFARSLRSVDYSCDANPFHVFSSLSSGPASDLFGKDFAYKEINRFITSTGVGGIIKEQLPETLEGRLLLAHALRYVEREDESRAVMQHTLGEIVEASIPLRYVGEGHRGKRVLQGEQLGDEGLFTPCATREEAEALRDEVLRRYQDFAQVFPHVHVPDVIPEVYERDGTFYTFERRILGTLLRDALRQDYDAVGEEFLDFLGQINRASLDEKFHFGETYPDLASIVEERISRLPLTHDVQSALTQELQHIVHALPAYCVHDFDPTTDNFLRPWGVFDPESWHKCIPYTTGLAKFLITGMLDHAYGRTFLRDLENHISAYGQHLPGTKKEQLKAAHEGVLLVGGATLPGAYWLRPGMHDRLPACYDAALTSSDALKEMGCARTRLRGLLTSARQQLSMPLRNQL